MATDLNLHRRTATLGQDTQEGRARDKEVHNRERTWLICYILDRSISAQMGKPHSIKEEYVVYLLFSPFSVADDTLFLSFLSLLSYNSQCPFQLFFFSSEAPEITVCI